MRTPKLMIAGLVALATALSFASPGQAAVAAPELPKPVPATITIGGEQFNPQALRRAVPYVSTDARGNLVLKPGLSGEDKATATRYYALITKAAAAVKSGHYQKPSKGCAQQFWARMYGAAEVYIFLPSCSLPSLGAFITFAGAIAASAAALDAISEKVAKVIAAAVVALGAAIVASWEFCKAFFSDKGMFAVVDILSSGPFKVHPECASD